jgi:hypothetical protein
MPPELGLINLQGNKVSQHHMGFESCISSFIHLAHRYQSDLAPSVLICFFRGKSHNYQFGFSPFASTRALRFHTYDEGSLQLTIPFALTPRMRTSYSSVLPRFIPAYNTIGANRAASLSYSMADVSENVSEKVTRQSLGGETMALYLFS